MIITFVKSLIVFLVTLYNREFFINILINYSSNDIVANYMYLIEFPLGENLTRFMPDPPFHLFVFLPIAILLFFITYLPFYLKDRFFSQ